VTWLGDSWRHAALVTADSNIYIASVAGMATTGPVRRPRNAEAVPLFVKVSPEAKAIADGWARTANVNLWEVVEAAILQLHSTETDAGLPERFPFDPQPTLDVDPSERNATAA